MYVGKVVVVVVDTNTSSVCDLIDLRLFLLNAITLFNCVLMLERLGLLFFFVTKQEELMRGML